MNDSPSGLRSGKLVGALQALASLRYVGPHHAVFADVKPPEAGVLDHVHDCFSLQRVLAPSRIRLLCRGNEWKPVEPGCQLWRPGEHQRCVWTGDSRVQFLFVSAEQVETILRKPAPDWMCGRWRIDPASRRFAHAVLDAMTLDLADGSPAGSLVGDELLVAMLSRLASPAQVDGLRSTAPAFSRAMRVRLADFLQEHHGEPISLGQMAAVANVSVRHFGRIFKASFGLAPHQYLINLRIENAALLLEESDLAVAEVALRAGFCDQGQFSRVFKRAVGRTPSAYRRGKRA